MYLVENAGCNPDYPKVGEVIGNQNQVRSRPGQSSRKYSLGKRVRVVTVRNKVSSTTDCQQGLLPTYPRDVMFETKVLKTESTTFVTHQHPPRYLLLSDSYDPRMEVRLSNKTSCSVTILVNRKGKKTSSTE